MSTVKPTSQDSDGPPAAASRRSVLNTVAAQDVKRQGVRAIVEKLEAGPVHVLQHNRPSFVALREEQYRHLVEEIEDSRIRASLADVEAGRVQWASPRELTEEIFD